MPVVALGKFLLDDVADEVKNKLEIIPVKKVTEVLKLVLK